MKVLGLRENKVIYGYLKKGLRCEISASGNIFLRPMKVSEIRFYYLRYLKATEKRWRRKQYMVVAVVNLVRSSVALANFYTGAH